MKTKLQIKTTWGSILWESEKETLTEAVLEKYAKDADLRGADLRGADLRGADLRGADLRGANLYGADLRGANLYGANLYGADLYGADLRGADLYGADLRGANLYKLPVDFINQCSRDMLFIMQQLKSELPYLKKSLLEGKVNGSQYTGTCACFVGTLANGKKESVDNVCNVIPFYQKGTHNMGETWFLNIKEGDKPETNEFSAHVLKLIEMVETGNYYTISYDEPKKEEKPIETIEIGGIKYSKDEVEEKLKDLKKVE